VVFGAIQAMPGAASTDLAIRSGADFVILDCEHGLADETAHAASLQLLAKEDAFSAIRVRPRDLGAVEIYAQLGADVILMPDVKSAAAAQAFVAAGRDKDQATQKQTPVLMAMIESQQAVAQIREIAATPGLGALVVGPNDLCADLGNGVDFGAPIFQEALVAVERAAAEAAKILGSGVYPGIPVSRLLTGGHTFILAVSDVGALQAGYRDAFKDARAALKGTS
jgi:4-hydroxy-2-oxoheptanedioate aldolase